MSLARTRRASMLALSLLAGLPFLAACHTDPHTGQKTLFAPPAALNVTSLHLARRQEVAPPAPEKGKPAEPAKLLVSQSVAVDLTTGRATFVNTDGKRYPTQIDKDTVEQLRKALANRDWQVGVRRPAEGVADPMRYTLTAYDGDKPFTEQAVWCNPTRRPLPKVMATLEEFFDTAQRVAYPLSDTHDLTK